MNLEPGSVGRSRPSVSGGDACIAVGWLLATALLYAATFQGRMYGDGGLFANKLVGFSRDGTSAVLYLPLARLVSRGGGGDDPLGSLKLLSIVGGALGVSCTWLIARGVGARRGGAATACALLALSPMCWFFSTTIELHALHFGVTAACVVVTLYAPWRRPAWALAMTLLAFPLVYLTHKTGLLLLPGWVALVQVARSRVAAPFRLRTLLFGVAPALSLAALATIVIEERLTPSRELTELGTWVAINWSPGITMLWEGWLLPHFLLLPIAAYALLVLPLRTALRFALWLSVLVPWAAMIAIGVPELGAYFLGSAPLLAAAVACVPVERRMLPVLVLVVLQAVAGFGQVRRFDRGFQIADRVAIVREIVGEERGLLLSVAGNSAARIEIHLPRVAEYNLSNDLIRARVQGECEEQFAARIVARIEQVLERTEVVLVDQSYRHAFQADLNPTVRGAPTVAHDFSRLTPYLQAFEVALHESFEVEYAPDRSWPMMIVRPR